MSILKVNEIQNLSGTRLLGTTQGTAQTYVATLSDLPSTGIAGEGISVGGFYAAADGGGGVFIWANEARILIMVVLSLTLLIL